MNKHTRKTSRTTNASFGLTAEMTEALSITHGQTGMNLTAIMEIALRLHAGKNNFRPTSPTKAKRNSTYGLHLSETGVLNLNAIVARDHVTARAAMLVAVQALAELLSS